MDGLRGLVLDLVNYIVAGVCILQTFHNYILERDRGLAHKDGVPDVIRLGHRLLAKLNLLELQLLEVACCVRGGGVVVFCNKG